ncbi:MAG: 16S rRNA (cytosine(1402)-N(4))-methyltransferase RsmH [Coriobacteriia bacterium]|nr:16S rRNA (cytosine(1402)-N(4))-methyltransferase RsmH [Coriobacteriia bacterium]
MSTLIEEYRHQPVMLSQVERHLDLKAGEVFCDCTIGGGGHSLYLGQHLQAEGLLIGIDQDQAAIDVATSRINALLPNLNTRFFHGNFQELDDFLLETSIPGVDAFLFDLGVSSFQLDSPNRGFSYSHDAPLDMRMNPGNQTLTAQEVINTLSEADLTRIFHEFGEEKWAGRIAKEIVSTRKAKPYSTTSELVETIRKAIPAPARRTGGNPAKRSFQALRIYVNSELDALVKGLDAALRWTNPGGRIVVLSYQSLEDRIIKQAFAEATQACTCPPEAIICVCGNQSVFDLLTVKPERADSGEVNENPRSRSAKLRAVVRHVD